MIRNAGVARGWPRAVVLALAIATLGVTSERSGPYDRIFFEPETVASVHDLRGRAFGMWFASLEGKTFAVNANAVRVVLRCVHFCTTGTTRTLAVRETGTIASTLVDDRSYAQVDVAIPDDVPWGIYQATVTDSDGAATNNSVSTQSATISIPPSADDTKNDHLAAMRRKYIGRIVQGYGDLVLACDDPHAAAEERARSDYIRKHVLRPGGAGMLNHDFIANMPTPAGTSLEVGNEPSLTVTSIGRDGGAPKAWRLGGGMANRESTEDVFVSVTPLVVSFAPAHLSTRCVNPHIAIADAWELERTLWIHKPVHVSAEATIRTGLPMAMVAHILGFPAEFGSVDDMWKRRDWTYIPMMMPYDYAVAFRNGRVAAYRPPAHNP